MSTDKILLGLVILAIFLIVAAYYESEHVDNYTTDTKIATEPLIGDSKTIDTHNIISVLHMRIPLANRIATYIANVPLTPFKAPMKMLPPTLTVPPFLLWKSRFLAPIRNQGDCGACWAFGLTSTIADRMALLTGGAFRKNLSVQELLRCFDPSGCQGGSPEDAAMWMTGELTAEQLKEYPKAYQRDAPILLSLEDAEPYRQAKSETVRGHCDDLSVDGLKIGIVKGSVFSCVEFIPEKKYSQDILNKNIENMKRALYSEGPLYCAMTVYEDLFAFPGTSVYKHASNSALVGGHCIEVIGYSEKGQDKRFKDAYWVCRNSWSASWPTKSQTPGYFMIRMGFNECGIESRVGGCTPMSNIHIAPSDLTIRDFVYTDFESYYKK
jgi:hypothetical protein